MLKTSLRLALALLCIAGLTVAPALAGDGAGAPGGVGGAANETPTSWFVELASPPAVKGTSTAKLKAEHDAFKANAAADGVKLTERYSYDSLWNGVSVSVVPATVAAHGSIPGVKAVYPVHTVSLPDFPTLFMLLGPHSPLNYIAIHESAELQSDYVMQMLEALNRDGIVGMAPTQEATERWLAYIREGMPGTVWASGCTSWYLGDGDTPVLWPYSRREWHAALRRPDLADYEVRRAPVPV